MKWSQYGDCLLSTFRYIVIVCRIEVFPKCDAFNFDFHKANAIEYYLDNNNNNNNNVNERNHEYIYVYKGKTNSNAM